MSESDIERLAMIAVNLARHAYTDPLPFDPERYRRTFMSAVEISALDPGKIAREAMADA